MTGLEEIIDGTRSSAGLFPMAGRALLEVEGSDRVRWLDGMISGDVEALEAAGSGAGCYAALLTNRGAIIADLHVGRLGERFVLESARASISKIREALERFIIADDVTLTDRSADFVALGLEGPCAAEILAEALGRRFELSPLDWSETEIDGRPVRIGAFGFSGEPAYQLYVAPNDRAALEVALEAAGESRGAVRGDAPALEVMRIEAGIPLLGAELGEDVLPPEARLEHAISTTKGCYVGQEIVARLRARGQVNHLLVGLRIEGDTLPEPDSSLVAGERRTGEVTSSGRSPRFGPIALGFVRREHSESGTRVEFEGGTAEVCALPFEQPSGQSRGSVDPT
jgi:folate-binding protein YgfZ